MRTKQTKTMKIWTDFGSILEWFRNEVGTLSKSIYDCIFSLFLCQLSQIFQIKSFLWLLLNRKQTLNGNAHSNEYCRIKELSPQTSSAISYQPNSDHLWGVKKCRYGIWSLRESLTGDPFHSTLNLQPEVIESY